MSERRPHGREIIESAEVIQRGNVTDVEWMKIGWSIAITVISLLIAVAFLAIGIWTGTSDLVTWATSLISAIAGAAISYGFNSKG